ncbi:MAG: ATP-binding protein [Sulfurovum sp.]
MLGKNFKIVYIEVSGSFDALELFISTLRDDSNMAYVVAQNFETTPINDIINRLLELTNIPISQIKDREIADNNHIYIYPCSMNVTIKNFIFNLTTPEYKMVPKSSTHKLLDNVVRLVFMDNSDEMYSQNINYYTNQTLYNLKSELIARKEKLKLINSELQESNGDLQVANNKLKEYKNSLEKTVEIRTKNLEQSKNDIEHLLNSIDSIIVVSRNGTQLLKVNEQFFKFFELKNLDDFFAKHECVCDFFEVCDDDGFIYKQKALDDGYSSWIDFILKHPDISYKAKIIRAGKTYIFNLKITILSYDKDDILYVIFMNDITLLHEYQTSLELKVEEEIKKRIEKDKFLIHQSKLASMGEMIGNIAHQWRQPLNQLSLINITLDTLMRKNRLNLELFEKYFEQTNSTIQSMSETINDFRYFFQPDKEISVFTLSSIFDESLKFLKEGLARHSIEIDIEGYSDCEIVGHKNELVQVLLNLVNNSKDAIVLTEKKDGKIWLSVERDKDIKIKLQDNGGGIEDDIIDKVFEPYFTTKFKEEGTGIGMYMSKMIIEQSMCGKLYIENRDEGVLVTITLPLGDKDA